MKIAVVANALAGAMILAFAPTITAHYIAAMQSSALLLIAAALWKRLPS